MGAERADSAQQNLDVRSDARLHALSRVPAYQLSRVPAHQLTITHFMTEPGERENAPARP